MFQTTNQYDIFNHCPIISWNRTSSVPSPGGAIPLDQAFLAPSAKTFWVVGEPGKMGGLT